MKQGPRAEGHCKADREWFGALSHALNESLGETTVAGRSRPAVTLLSVSDSGNAFEVELRFKADRRYCCAEPGCFMPCHAAWWARFRESLAEVTEREPPPMSITIHGIVEEGAELVSTLQVGGQLRS